ncbi:hypothetical protein BGZ51_002237 [Haplosporangium sp. Z 767]|nr:hypothetical protein BGZ51_002237 [Haplosporangium sp. Z 767]
MGDVNARLQFLWKASHMLLSTSPGASAHYMSQFRTMASERDLKLHEDIQAKACAACGTIFLPGVNTKVKVVPVQQTRVEKERRKKKAKKVKKKQMLKESKANKDANKDSVITGSDTATEATTTTTNISTTATLTSELTSTTATPSTDTSADAGTSTTTPTIDSRSEKPGKRRKESGDAKVIQLIPYTEIFQKQHQQQLKRQQQAGRQEAQYAQGKKAEMRDNQILNHIIYACQRCHRQTELPGTKQGYLTSRIKVTKPVSQHRKMKKMQLEAAAKITESSASVSATSTAQSAVTGASSIPNQTASFASPTTNSKRPGPPLQKPDGLDVKRPKHSVSMPTSPVTALSTSAAPSAATSPASSPRPSGGNRKKKKGGLANLLASKKTKDPSTDPDGGNGASGGDSVLANFLMGL